MGKRRSQGSGPPHVLDIVWTVLRTISMVAFGSIAGYMMVGGVIGLVGVLAGLDWAVLYAAPIGWLAGAFVGLGNVVFRPETGAQRRRPAEDDSPPVEEATSHGSEVEVRTGSRFKIPTLGELAKSVGVSAVFGLVGGLLTSAFLALILISVTTSPFVPNSWRPGTAASFDEDERDEARNRSRSNGGASVGTSFTHPLLSPIFFWSTATLVSVGLLAGVVNAFFTGNEDSVRVQTKPEADLMK